jgi:hypothetical protein
MKKEYMMTMQSPETQIFHNKHRGQYIVQGLIFLVFSGSCFIQAYTRFGLPISQFWNAWWFLILLGLGFAVLTVENIYKVFFTRLVFSPREFIYYDFLKVTRMSWDQVEKAGEIDLKMRNRKDFGLLLKDSAIEKPNLLSMPFISLLPFFTRWNEDPIKQWLKDHQPRLLKK